MTIGFAQRSAKFGRLFLFVGFLLLAAVTAAWAADAATPAPPAGNDADFGQYVAGHQEELGPVFSRNAGDIFKKSVPLLMGMTSWVVLLTMLIGWAIDILLSRGFAFLFAPSAATIKKSVLYSTGQLFLSFIYTFLMGIAIVFCLGLSHAVYFIAVAVMLLVLVSFAAQVVWVLYIYHTRFIISILFYVLVLLVHAAAGLLLAGPFFGAKAPAAVAQFIDGSITPKLRDEAEASNHALVQARQDLASVQSKTNSLKSRLSQAEQEKEKLRQQIEEKKNSDIYALAQILKLRARGELTAAHEQLAAFSSKFPTSELNGQVRSQITDLDSQIAAQTAEQKQAEADTARANATARQELLDHAAKGQATLSEMRQALLGKSREEVKALLGSPSTNGPDTWNYEQKMILNPITNERTGLVINFSVGQVQGVDALRTKGGTDVIPEGTQ